MQLELHQQLCQYKNQTSLSGIGEMNNEEQSKKSDRNWFPFQSYLNFWMDQIPARAESH